MKFNYEFIEKLTQINGISGHEEKIRKELYNYLKDDVDNIHFDNLGSIIFEKQKKEPAIEDVNVMIAAHMDQIGFVVNYIDEKGFCFVKPIGGWYPTQLLTQEVEVETENGDKYIGIFGHKDIGELKKKKEIEWQDIYIDFGVNSKEELEDAGVQIGDPITPLSSYKKLINPKFVATTAWDNRVGCAIISELTKNLKGKDIPCNLFLAGTVQEEVGIRGAKTASKVVNPDICFSIDIGAYGDTPSFNKYDSTLECGKGPAICIFDATSLGNKKLIKLIKKVAKENNIPYQLDIMMNGGTDNGAMHLNERGAFGVTISIPTRYGHSHNSIINTDDLENATKLFMNVIKELDSDFLKDLKTFL